ncbi:MAG: hypothetical protein R3F39_10160 [Myxococcota bacterium]
MRPQREMLGWVVLGLAFAMGCGGSTRDGGDSADGQVADVVSDAKGEVGLPDVVADADVAPDADVLPDASPDADVAPDVDATPDADALADADAVPEVDAVPDAVPDGDTEADAEPDADAIPDAEPDADAVPDVKPDADAVPDVKPDADAVADVKPDADAVADVKPDAVPDVKPDADATPDAKPDADAVPDAKPDVIPDVIADAKPDADAVPDVIADVKPDTKPDAVADVKPDVKPDADATPDIGPDITCTDPNSPCPLPMPAAVGECDAGDAAFVARAIQAVWGRRPLGFYEIEVWSQLVEQAGREAALDAMMRDDAYVQRWSDFMMDALHINRTGDKQHDACWGSPALPPDGGELAAFVRDTPPGTTAGGPGSFNMTDLLQSALRLDDISPVYRGQLFAMLQKPLTGANVDAVEMERSRRNDFGEVFEATYIYRQKACMDCHNSNFSVTGDADPALDRTWEIPGHFEVALFDDPQGIEEEKTRAMLRSLGVHTSSLSGVKPWGWSSTCGRFVKPASIGADALGVSAYFIEEQGDKASVWELEDALAQGYHDLREDGLDRDPETLEVPGEEAFAYLVSINLANQVWTELMGYPLTIANYFPRNRDQRDTLWLMTERSVNAGFSFKSLVKSAVLDPRFNQLPPEAGCGNADGYYMRPTFNPWSPAEVGSLQGNSVGDILVRHGARTLLRAVASTLGWPQPDDFPSGSDEAFQGAIGAFTRDAEPGFRGTDLQGLLAWEDRYGLCSQPVTGGGGLKGPGCEAVSTAGCDGCTCEACTCDADDFCCSTQWDDLCVGICNDDCGGCDVTSTGDASDFVGRLAAVAALPAGAHTLQDAVTTLKDRVIQEPLIATAEKPLLEALLGSPLSTPAAQVPKLETALRKLCGALLGTPQFVLFGSYPFDWPTGPPGIVMQGAGFADQCAAAKGMWDSTSWTVTCSASAVTVTKLPKPPL